MLVNNLDKVPIQKKSEDQIWWATEDQSETTDRVTMYKMDPVTDDSGTNGG